MKWKIFSRKKRKEQWRLIFQPDGDMADVMALPGAVVEGQIAGRYLLASGGTAGTVIIQGVRRKGILAGVDVAIDHQAASEHDVDVAYQPRGGRASLRPAETVNFEEMMLNASDKFVSTPTDPEDLACLLYTSGTTGRPKGVRLTVKNFLCEQQATQKLLEITPQDKIIGVLPFFHVFGLSNVLLIGLAHGASIVLIPQYSPGNLLKAIIEHHPTLVIAIPTMFGHLLMLLERKKVRLPQNIRLCVSGAAPLPKEMIGAFETCSGARVLEGYGLTETVAACCVNPPDGVCKAGSIGLPLSGFEMKIVDADGKELPAEEVGEIAVRGEGVTPGYYNLPQDTEEAFRDGWFLTGDTGYKDQDGYFFVTDRKKEIIIKGGLNISPREVEDVLLSHPVVKEAAVIGRKKGEREEIVAFVTTRGEVSAKELVSHCKQALSSFKVPDEICFMETLPMSVTGKVLKKELTGDYQDERRIERKETGSGSID
ncbi:MAG: acyl-CoA synthetase [Deltaproteobacteria bacterium]|nr:MAG: acyl-CoA synthetase [Deltaproteobacteria bacterium]